jgi:hypothetical protein
MIAVAAAVLSVGIGDLPRWAPGEQMRALCRPWEFAENPPSQEMAATSNYFTFQEPIPSDVVCPESKPCLIARPDVPRVFSWGQNQYQGFELVLANPTSRPVRLVFPQTLPIVREALSPDGWRMAEAWPCWPWCGNANSATDLKPGHCFRFAVPVYAGELRLTQRFRGVLIGGTLMADSRVEVVSNEFESTLSAVQLLPANDCLGLVPVIDTTVSPGGTARRDARMDLLPVGRTLVQFCAELTSR